MLAAWRAYQRFTPFTDKEAWSLFRLAAYLEAAGWTMLIIGIACKRLPVPWNDVPVSLAGRIHGLFFIVYIVAALVLAPSLKWSFFNTILAAGFSVPPYGSIIFEKCMAFFRWRADTYIFYYHSAYRASLEWL